MADNDIPSIPPVLRDLLIRVRRDLKEKGVSKVELGLPEMRAIYAMSTAVHSARESRNEWAKKAKTLAKQAALTKDEDHLRDRSRRAILALMIDIERLLSGEETSTTAVRATHKRVREFIDRSRGKRK